MQGLTVQGVSRVRLTPYPNQSVSVPDEVKTVLAVRNLARQFTENKIAIVAAGRGLPPAALTVRAHVRLLIIGAGLARLAASTKQRESIETAEHRSEIPRLLGMDTNCGYEASVAATIEIEL